MEIRSASLKDRAEIVRMLERSQLMTGLPDPRRIPANELDERLYARRAIERYVAVDDGRIVGHGLIEEANPNHEVVWRSVLPCTTESLIEMGGAFVEPKLGRLGIWTALLRHRIEVIRDNGSIPVSATWSENEHVRRKFEVYGGINAGRQYTEHGDVDLFAFPLQ